MGAESSKCVYKHSLIEIDVSKVEALKPEEKEEFKKNYCSDICLHPDNKGYKERLDNAAQIMYERYNWLENNKDKYVNMLRIKGFSDKEIQEALSGRKPFCFKSRNLFDEFCEDLVTLKMNMEKASEFKEVIFFQAGSSVTGFSNNPLKGLEKIPSKITQQANTHYDIVIAATNVKDYFKKIKSKKPEIKFREYSCISNEKGATDKRYALKNISDLDCKSLEAFHEKWAKKLNVELQITFQDGRPEIPPWELEIPLRVPGAFCC